jgi:hypothetical protein
MRFRYVTLIAVCLLIGSTPARARWNGYGYPSYGYPSTALAVWKHFLRNISRIRISYRKRKTQTGPAETRKLPKQC